VGASSDADGRRANAWGAVIMFMDEIDAIDAGTSLDRGIEATRRKGKVVFREQMPQTEAEKVWHEPS